MNTVERIRIQDLTVEKPVEETNFDLPNGFYLRSWQAYQMVVKENADPNFPTEELWRFRTAARLRVIASLTAEDLKFDEKEKWLKRIDDEKSLIPEMSKPPRSRLLGYLSHFKMLFPEEIERLMLNEEIWDRLIKESSFVGSIGVDLLKDGFNLKLIFPDRFSEIDLSGKWNDISKSLSVGRSFFGMSPARYLASLRMIFPEKWENIKPQDEQLKKMWQGIHAENLTLYRSIEEEFYFNIVRAEKVTVDENDFKLVIPPKLEGEPELTLPVTRNF